MKTKRLLSVLLAIIMVVAMLPTAFASDAGTDTIEYVFNCNAFGEKTNITDAAIVTKKKSDIADGYNKWNIEGVSQVRTGSAIQKGALYILASTNRVTDAGTNTIATAIVLDVTQTGTFIPKLTYTGLPNSPKYKVYFAKKKTGDDVSGWCNGSKHNSNNAKLNAYIATLTDAEYLGEVDTYWQTSTANMSKELKEINITEEGAYYLILADNGISSLAGTISDVQTYITSFTLTPAETQEDVISAFALDGSVATTHSASLATTCAALDKKSITATASAADTDGDGVYYVTADEFDSTGEYSFLYWVKGLTSDKTNKIVSLSPTIEEYKPQNGGNYLIAVYENKNAETEAKAEFYDGNGQLLYTTVEDDIDENDVTVSDGVIEIPSLPQMANYERATHWQLYGDSSNTKYGADVATAELSGNMIFVAQYDDVYITVNGDDVRYGDSVPFTAKDDTEKEYFKWWTRTANGVGEIVSLKREYIFCPWEDCTVTAVYGDEKQIIAGNLRKIVLNKLGNNAIMAEFIGLDGAEVVEKGIVLGEKKIAMSTSASQFTITNNIGATSASGYAIIKDGNSYVEITDGTIALNQ